MQSLGGCVFAAELSRALPAHLSQIISSLPFQKHVYCYCNYLFLWC